MDHLNQVALVAGYFTLAIGGGIACIALLLAVYAVAGVFGLATYNRLRRVYHLNVINYWLRRLEKEGTHVFEKVGEQGEGE